MALKTKPLCLRSPVAVVHLEVVCDSLVTPWTVALQALSMGFPRQEYWSGLPFPSPGNLPNPGIKLTSPVSPALAGRFFFFFFLPLSHQGSASSLVPGSNLMSTSWLPYLLASHLQHSQKEGLKENDAWSSLFLFLKKANAFSEARLSRILLKYHWPALFTLSEGWLERSRWLLNYLWLWKACEKGFEMGIGMNQPMMCAIPNISKFWRQESLHICYFPLNIGLMAKSKSLDVGVPTGNMGKFLLCQSPC